MATHNGTFNFYDNWIKVLAEGANLSSDTLKMLLTTSAHVPNSASHTQISDITNELSGNGYSRQTLATPSWTQSGGLSTYDCSDLQFIATAGTNTAKQWHIFDDTLAGDILIAWGLIDATGINVSFTQLDFTINAAGLFVMQKV